jgi:hypothetical protein
MPLRFAFSLINNFVFLPSLGALARAYMWGWLPDVKGLLPALVGQALLAVLVGGLLRFALAEREQALRAALGPPGLYVGFAAYRVSPTAACSRRPASSASTSTSCS